MFRGREDEKESLHDLIVSSSVFYVFEFASSGWVKVVVTVVGWDAKLD